MVTDERLAEIFAGRERERLSHPCGTGHTYRCLAPLVPYGPCDCICHDLIALALEQAASLSAAMEQLEARGKDTTIGMAVLYKQMEKDRSGNKAQQQRVVVLEKALRRYGMHRSTSCSRKLAISETCGCGLSAALAGTQRLDSDPIQERNRKLAESHGARIPSPFESTAGGTQTGETQ